jgi:sulfane dehydrogenase subunit SoxC
MRRAPALPRRTLLQGSLTLAGTGVASAAEPDAPLAIPQWTREQGASVLAAPYGSPSPHERGVVRRPRRSAVFPQTLSCNTPLQHLHGIITPNGLHFIRDHAGTPDIDPAQHRLVVHGMVARPLIFTMDDLLRFPSVSRLHFLECAGNTPFWKTGAIKATWTAQDTHGLLSCAEWTGVRLADVLAEVGVQPGAAWLLAEGADAAALTRSVPLEKALDDAILAYAQNGERLRPEQGYPLRLLLPGYEGNTNIKWLRRIKLGDAPWETREETSRYTELQPDGTARQFGFVMEVKSVITHPSGGEALGAGYCEISGLAWSGRGRIRRVEVSVDGGTTWREAALQAPVLDKCLTRFRLPWHWQGEALVLQSRATDETGAVQPTRAALVGKQGEHADYHYNAIHAWRVAADGQVSVAL